MKILLCTIILFISFTGYAYGSLFGYCLADGESLQAGKQHLSSILAPGDQLFIRASVNCLEVKGGGQRFDLYRKFLKSNFRIIRTYKDHDTGASLKSVAPKGMCRIFVTKLGENEKVTDKVKISRRGKISRSESNGTSKSTSNLILTYGKRGSLSVNSQSIGLTCKKTGSGYLLAFDLESKSSAISSNAFVTPGQSLNIGGIVNDLNNKRRTLSIDQGVEYEKEAGKEKFDYFLKVK